MTARPALSWEPLWPSLERIVRDAQPDRFRWPRPNAEGWIGPIHSPLREDCNPSFSLRPDSPSDAGGWKDFATGERGSMADLARRFGVDPRRSVPDELPQPVAETPRPDPGDSGTLDGFSERRHIRPETLDRWKVREVTDKGRPALRFPTVLKVDRAKYIDGRKPKQRWIGEGGHAHWYGLGSAKQIGGDVLYLVNGEASVWACSQSNVPATCTCAGEGTKPTEEMIEVLENTTFSKFKIVYDLDEHGRKGAEKMLEVLVNGGLDVAVLELPAHLGDGGDVDDLHRLVGDDALADRLADLDVVDASTTSTPIEAPEREWPTLDPVALHGLAGDVVRVIEPHTESDPAAILAQFLVGFGTCVGRTPFFGVESDRHGMNESVVLVGRTSRARKGTSWRHVRAILADVDPVFTSECVASGLSSGEGVIWAVRDKITKMQTPKKGGPAIEVVVDEGVTDKRLLIIESEYASVLKMMTRKGNTLSPVIRDAWDGYSLRSLVKNSPASATDPHISILGHITEMELRNHLTETEAANGYGNRVIWLCVRRSKMLPEGGRPQREDLAVLIRRVQGAIDHARRGGELKRTPEARAAWCEVYPHLSSDRPGLLGAMIARAEAHVTRLATLYALLDESREVTVDHLRAALALWQYAEDSAQYVFGDSLGDPVADRLLEVIRECPEGMTTTEIHNALSNNYSASRISSALKQLEGLDLIAKKQVKTKGRPALIWYPVR